MTWDHTWTNRKTVCLAALLALDGDDPEREHVQADMALLDMIDDNEIRAAFLALERWYA